MLKDNIPNFCYTIKQVKDVIDAIQPEIDRINEELDKMKSDVHITTTNCRAARNVENFKVPLNKRNSIVVSLLKLTA